MNNLDILRTIHETEDGYIFNEIIENEFIYEYLVIEYSVCNAGVTTNSYFTNDLEDYADQTIIFLVEELAQIENLEREVA